MPESILPVDEAGERIPDSLKSTFESVKCIPEAWKGIPDARLSTFDV